MVDVGKSDLQLEVTVDIDFEEDFPDRYDELYGTIITEKEKADDNISYADKPTTLPWRK